MKKLRLSGKPLTKEQQIKILGGLDPTDVHATCYCDDGTVLPSPCAPTCASAKAQCATVCAPHGYADGGVSFNCTRC